MNNYIGIGQPGWNGTTKKENNLGEMHKFLETYNLLKLIQEEAENMNRPITISEIEAVIKKLPSH